MTKQDDPMPLGELSGYIKSARESGQGDYVPVVEMGSIVDDRPRRSWMRPLALASAACLLLAVAGVYVSTREITIVSGAGIQAVSEIVAGDGGRVMSVRTEEDGSYRVRVFTFGGMKSLIEKLRDNKEFDSVGVN
jgi:hypothetical protein